MAGLVRRFVLALAVASASASSARADDAAWAAARTGGAVVLVRHATAPGTGDPPGFRLDECATQRNLSDAGRREAVRFGDRLRANGVAVEEVRSSRWCRALETARLAFPALSVLPEPALDSFFGEGERRDGQTRQVRDLIRGWSGRGSTLVLVTHQVNVTALTRIVPQEGEAIVVRPNATGFEIAGRIPP